MIQFNLLPDVKLQYIKAQRQQRLAMTGAFIAVAASVSLLVLLFSFGQLQSKHINDLSKGITADSNTLKNEKQISKILTVQNQLQQLTSLHAAKPDLTRLSAYLNQITPSNVFIGNLDLNTTTQSATISGTSDALSSVNKYVDTLKFTTYTTDQVTDKTHAFANVVMSSFSLSSTAKDPAQKAAYTITLTYDKAIFDVTQNVKLQVPDFVSTRSEIPASVELFKASGAPAPTDPNAPTTTPTTGGTH